MGSAGAVIVKPDRDLVLSLNTAARGKIYTVLGRFEENEHQSQPFTFRPDLLDERFEKSKVSKPTIDGFKRLLYQHGNVCSSPTPLRT